MDINRDLYIYISLYLYLYISKPKQNMYTFAALANIISPLIIGHNIAIWGLAIIPMAQVLCGSGDTVILKSRATANWCSHDSFYLQSRSIKYIRIHENPWKSMDSASGSSESLRNFLGYMSICPCWSILFIHQVVYSKNFFVDWAEFFQALEDQHLWVTKKYPLEAIMSFFQ